MNDDERLGALFRAAASDTDAPPPLFDHDDVVSTSRRITARRRSAVVGAAAVIAVFGIGAAVVLPGSGGDTLTSAAAPAAAPLSAPEAAQDSAGEAADGSGSGAGSNDAGSNEAGSSPAPYEAGPDRAGAAPVAPQPPAATSGKVPLGPGTRECADRQDPALLELLEQGLPDMVGAIPAATTDVCLPGTHRYLSLQVADGAASGVLTVSYLPPGTIADLAPGVLSAPTASGGTVLVGSTGSGSSAVAVAPFADRLPEVLAFLAPRL